MIIIHFAKFIFVNVSLAVTQQIESAVIYVHRVAITSGTGMERIDQLIFMCMLPSASGASCFVE